MITFGSIVKGNENSKRYFVTSKDKGFVGLVVETLLFDKNTIRVRVLKHFDADELGQEYEVDKDCFYKLSDKEIKQEGLSVAKKEEKVEEYKGIKINLLKNKLKPTTDICGSILVTEKNNVLLVVNSMKSSETYAIIDIRQSKCSPFTITDVNELFMAIECRYGTIIKIIPREKFEFNEVE